MKKFMFAAALSCFGNMTLLDTNVFGMHSKDMIIQEYIETYNKSIVEAKKFFVNNNIENLLRSLIQADDAFESNIITDKRQLIIGQHTEWLNLIQSYMNDPRYVNALNILLIFATKWDSMDTIQLILSNPQTSCDTLVGGIADTTAIHEVAYSDMGAQILDYFLSKRPDSKFDVINKYGYTPLGAAISKGNMEVVQWLLNLYQVHGTDIGQCYEQCQAGGSVLGQLLDVGDDEEIFFLLMDYKGRDGRYLFSADWPCYGAYSNILVQVIICWCNVTSYMYDKDIYRVLLSDRIDSLLGVFRLNWVFVPSIYMPRLSKCIISLHTKVEQALQDEFDAVEKERFRNVLSAIDIYTFWNNVENGDFNTALELLNSGRVCLPTICKIIASNNLNLSSQFFENLYNFGMLIKHQPLCQALNICSFRKALEIGNLDNMFLLLREGWVDLSDVIKILDSDEFVLSNEIYGALVQIASNNVQYEQDMIRAIMQLDARVFERAIDSSDWLLALGLLSNNRVPMISFNKWDELIIWLQRLDPDEISIEECDELLGCLQCLQPTMQQQNFDMQIQNTVQEGINILNQKRASLNLSYNASTVID